jgi:hypothetical protein
MITIETFKTLALSFPDSVESPHFEKTSFRIKNKIFATLDIPLQRACLKLSIIDQSVFSAIDAKLIYPVDNKWGKQGWTFVELKTVNKHILKDILSKAYHTVAGKTGTAKK